MKFFLAVFLLSSAVVLVASAPDGEKYSNKYDNFDIDTVLSNERILKNYVKCLLDNGPCTPEGKDFKKILPESLATSCEKCTDSQKTIMRKIIKKLSTRGDDWEQLMDKYDKERQYQEKIKKFVAQN